MSRKSKNARRMGYARPLTTDAKAAPAAEPRMMMLGDKCGYEYKRLMSTILETDASYQRKIDVARVERIAAGFDARLVNTVKVSNRDGHFYVFDGAHTLAALKRIHAEQPFQVDCKVFHGLTYEEEAYLFALQTGESKDVAFGVRMRAMLISRSEEAEDFRAHTANAGLALADGPGSATKHTIAALAKAYKLYKDRGPEEYERILRLVVDTWDGAPWSLTSYILGGVGVFLQEYGGGISRERFVKRLCSVGYEELRDEARRQQRSSSDIAHALAIAKAYNRGGGRGTVDARLLTLQD